MHTYCTAREKTSEPRVLLNGLENFGSDWVISPHMSSDWDKAGGISWTRGLLHMTP